MTIEKVHTLKHCSVDYHKRLNRWSGHATLMVEDYSITVETPMCATIDAAVGSLKKRVVEAYLKFNKDDQQQPTV